MAQLTNIAGGANDRAVIAGISEDAQTLICNFEEELQEELSSNSFKPIYTSIDDILKNKYHLNDINLLEFPNYALKTEFIVKGVRGNVQKANGNILTYSEAEDLISDAAEEELP